MITTRKGFTLMELLIVVTVFAITFALLTPFVNKMRERADVIKCSANARLLSLGLHMYAADHDDAFPPDLGSLYPGYIKEEKVFDCPASKFIGTAAKSDYEYVYGLSEASGPSEVIIYDRDGNHSGLGRNVVRVNGSVEWVHSSEGKPR
ncbi:MAG: prepilin-type N-terminal cleavage/methylation domain-containing protein [Candidatus Omnitrophota bacterium]|nr:prepilin-type N-terminal cleavage/methylation domain-containing protein [Candidatus Omnitrophota bacterium]